MTDATQPTLVRSLAYLPVTAADIHRELAAAGFPNLRDQQALALAEEAGEFVGAYRRWAGMARRTGSFDDVCAELADVVITAFVTADVLGINLAESIGAKLNVVFSRGFRDQPADVPADVTVAIVDTIPEF